MASIINYEQHAHCLMDPDLTLQVRLHMTMEVHDSLEIVNTSEYINFLKCYFGAFQSILTSLTKPQFCINPEHKLRNIVVKILNRLPHSEVLLPFIPDLLKLSLTVLTTDNDDNALISLRIIFDLLRNFRPNIELEIQPFLEFLNTIYHNFYDTVNHFFSCTDLLTSELEPMVKTVDGGLDPSSVTSFGQLNPSTRSIKIFTESLLVIMLLFELYTKLVQTDIPYLLHRMVNSISIPGPEKVPSHLKSQFTELKGVQVKTLSFLTNQLKSYADYIRPHQERLCKSIVNLLVTCPDSYSIRRELLGALKNVLSTNFKTWLFPMIDTLLDERILIGSDRVCIETLRSLAYSILAEIVHYVRGDLSLSQVEPIYENGVDQASMDEARVLLGCILDAFAGKLSSVKHILPKLLEEGEDEKKRSNLRQNLEALIQAMLNLQATPEHSKELSEYKTLIKILVMGNLPMITGPQICI